MTQTATEEFMQSLLESALSYAKAGLPVFPCHSPAKVGQCDCNHTDCTSPAKHPRTLNGFKDATTDELAIRRWWKMWPRANVAIAVPDGYAVLDVDGEEGEQALVDGDYVVPETATADTGKGWHAWFTTDTPIPPRAGLLPKVDIRGPGSYVIAPPSLHITGRQYTQRIPFEQIAPAPDWLVELATKASVSPEQYGGNLDGETVLHGVAEGQRDATLFRFASKLRYADIPYEYAMNLCTIAAQSCTPPFPESQMKKCLDSAYGRYQPSVSLEDQSGEATLLGPDSVRVELVGPSGPVEFVFADMERFNGNFDTTVSVQTLMPGTYNQRYVQRLNMLSHSARTDMRRELQEIHSFDKGLWAKLLNRAFDEAQRIFLGQDRTLRIKDIAAPSKIEYLVDRLALLERPTVLFGGGSACKTLILMSVMLAVSQGAPWQGRATQRRNCLMIDYETGEGTTGYRFRRLAEGFGLMDIPSNIFMWPANGVPIYDLVDPIRRAIEANNIGFIGIDHCAAACGTEPEKAEAALKFQRAISKFKLPIVAIAHINGDAASNPESVKRPFGSIFWENLAGLTWYLRREDQDEGSDLSRVGLFQRKTNDTGRLSDFGVDLTFQGDSGPIDLKATDLRQSATLLATKGVKFVIEQALRVPLTVDEIKEVTGLSENTVVTTIKRNPKMFERVAPGVTGAGNKQYWQRASSQGPLP